MDKLHFLGRGSAFNTKEGNTSAYYIKNNHLLLIDCGETVFDKILQINLLKDITEVDILITHFHSDHIGSLSNFINYLSNTLKIIPTITYPLSEEFIYFMELQGRVEGIHYKLNTSNKFFEDIEIIPSRTSHYELFVDSQTDEVIHNPKESNSNCINVFSSFGYYLKSPSKTIYYSGDSNEFNVDLSKVDLVYQDCSIQETNPYHLSFKKLCDLVDPKDRHKVYLIHIDSDELLELASEKGFNVVTLTPEPSIYILKTIHIKKKTNESIFKDWQIRNIEFHNLPIAYDEYVCSLEYYGEKEFELHSEDDCYFTNINNAVDYVTSNSAYINYGGAFDYLLIMKAGLGGEKNNNIHPEAYLFQLDQDSHNYKHISFKDCKEGKFILERLTSI